MLARTAGTALAATSTLCLVAEIIESSCLIAALIETAWSVVGRRPLRPSATAAPAVAESIRVGSLLTAVSPT